MSYILRIIYVTSVVSFELASQCPLSSKTLLKAISTRNSIPTSFVLSGNVLCFLWALPSTQLAIKRINRKGLVNLDVFVWGVLEFLGN